MSIGLHGRNGGVETNVPKVAIKGLLVCTTGWPGCPKLFSINSDRLVYSRNYTVFIEIVFGDGRANSNVTPESSLFANTRPPCASITFLTMVRPRPAPRGALARRVGAVKAIEFMCNFVWCELGFLAIFDRGRRFARRLHHVKLCF